MFLGFAESDKDF